MIRGGTASTEESSSFDDASSGTSSRGSTDVRSGVGLLDITDNSPHHKRKSKRASRNFKGTNSQAEREEALLTLKREATTKQLKLVDFRLGFHNALLICDELTLSLLIATYHSFFTAREFLDLIKTTFASSGGNVSAQILLLRIVGEWSDMRMSSDFINPKSGKPRKVLKDLVLWLETLPVRAASTVHPPDALWECSQVTRTKLTIYRNSQELRLTKRPRLLSNTEKHTIPLLSTTPSNAPANPSPEQLAEIANRETRNEQLLFARFFVLMAPYDIAQALTHIEHAMFKRIRPRELLQQAWKRLRPDPPRENAVSRFIARSTELSFWVATKIVKAQELDVRVSLVERFIEVAEACAELRNYNSCMGLLGGLNLYPVGRLKKTWAKVPRDFTKKMTVLESLLESKGNYRNYRAALRAHRTNHPEKVVLPYLGVYLRDLVFCDEGMDSRIEGMLNMEKIQVALQVLAEVKHFQNTSHSRSFMEDPEVISYYSNLRGSPDHALDKISRLLEPPQQSQSVETLVPVVVSVTDSSQIDTASTNSDRDSQNSNSQTGGSSLKSFQSQSSTSLPRVIANN